MEVSEERSFFWPVNHDVRDRVQRILVRSDWQVKAQVAPGVENKFANSLKSKNKKGCGMSQGVRDSTAVSYVILNDVTNLKQE